MCYVHEHGSLRGMLFDKTNGRVCDSGGIVIIIRKLGNPLQVMINGIWFVIASPSMQAAVVFVESPLNWITSIGGFKGRI